MNEQEVEQVVERPDDSLIPKGMSLTQFLQNLEKTKASKWADNIDFGTGQAGNRNALRFALMNGQPNMPTPPRRRNPLPRRKRKKAKYASHNDHPATVAHRHKMELRKQKAQAKQAAAASEEE
jgi:hypothetical protein